MVSWDVLRKYQLTVVSFIVISAGVPGDDRNWPPFFPIIHHDIASEIPIHAQRLQYLAFASWLGTVAHSYISIEQTWTELFLL
uniref:Secretory carrier-associated membrane protein n=1 Tax=Rhizophora mucronata TaxID=61149 RepID=A0A2P2KUK7_RHIMU